MNITRRGFLIKSAVGLLAAPAIVKVSSIMPVKAWTEPGHGFVTLVPWQNVRPVPSANWGVGEYGANKLGLAQMKIEGTPVLFDQPNLMWAGGDPVTVPAAERIYTGDMVSMFGGRAYRVHPLEPITHVAITSSTTC